MRASIFFVVPFVAVAIAQESNSAGVVTSQPLPVTTQPLPVTTPATSQPLPVTTQPSAVTTHQSAASVPAGSNSTALVPVPLSPSSAASGVIVPSGGGNSTVPTGTLKTTKTTSKSGSTATTATTGSATGSGSSSSSSSSPSSSPNAAVGVLQPVIGLGVAGAIFAAFF